MPIRWLMLAILFTVRLALGYQFQSVASTASHLVEEFGFSYAEVGTLIGFFQLPGIFFAIPIGAATRFVADKSLLLFGAVMMLVGALVMAFSSDPWMLYAGRLITGIGGTVFSVILTKMVTDWFFEKEIVTALAIILVAWPFGMVLGLLSQGWIADLYGWRWSMHATGLFALLGLLLAASAYRDAPRDTNSASGLRRYGLPLRQLVHTCVVGVAWTLFNAVFVVVVSFAPDVLMQHGYTPTGARSATSLVMWVSLLAAPLGGRMTELLGHVTACILVTLGICIVATVAVSQAVMPEAAFVALGIFFSIPVGALMALMSEAVTPNNRGPGLGIFYTWFYVGMTLAPAIAGWSRDVSRDVAAPIWLAVGMLAAVILAVVMLRLLQRTWPIEVDVVRPAVMH